MADSFEKEETILRRKVQDYTVQSEIEETRRQRMKQEQETQTGIERELYSNRHFIGYSHPKDTGAGANPSDEHKWGEGGKFYWMNKYGDNNVPMRNLVDPPF